MKLNASQGGIRTKSHFHETIEIDGRIYAAHLAMNGVANFAQRTVGLVDATAKGTEQVPLQIQQTRSRGSETRLKDLTTRDLPMIGEFVRTNTRY